MFLKNESSESVSLYDSKNSAYLESEVEIKEGDSIKIKKITKIIDKCIIWIDSNYKFAKSITSHQDYDEILGFFFKLLLICEA